jgi:hypothetical protein
VPGAGPRSERKTNASPSKCGFKTGRIIRKNEGKVVQFELSEAPHSVAALVVTRDSPAKKEGKGVFFQVCSDSCRTELTEAGFTEAVQIAPIQRISLRRCREALQSEPNCQRHLSR